MLLPAQQNSLPCLFQSTFHIQFRNDAFSKQLSSACLGKIQTVSIRDARLVWTLDVVESMQRTPPRNTAGSRPRLARHPPQRPACPKANATFFEFFLCLSRACLGKKMILSIKWRKNGFLTVSWSTSVTFPAGPRSTLGKAISAGF